jgi:hypothetical protein
MPLTPSQRTLDEDSSPSFYTYCISRRNLRGGMHLRVR